MRFGVCAPCDLIGSVEDLQADFFEENVQRFLLPERPYAEFVPLLARASALPIPLEAANSLLPPDLHLVSGPGRDVDRSRLDRYLRTTLERAAEAGIYVLVFGSGAARACPDGVPVDEAGRQIADHLAIWSEWARAYDIEIVLEPLRYGETNVVNTVTEGGALLAPIRSTGARLLADFYHMACNGEAPESLVAQSALLSHVHVAEQRDRSAPGRHGEDFRPYLAALRRAGYDRSLSIECDWQDFAAEANPALATMRAQWLAMAGSSTSDV